MKHIKLRSLIPENSSPLYRKLGADFTEDSLEGKIIKDLMKKGYTEEELITAFVNFQDSEGQNGRDYIVSLPSDEAEEQLLDTGWLSPVK